MLALSENFITADDDLETTLAYSDERKLVRKAKELFAQQRPDRRGST